MKVFKHFSRILRPNATKNYHDIDLDTPLICNDEEIQDTKPELSSPELPSTRSRLFSRLCTAPSAFATFLIPSFLQRHRNSKPSRITETSYLNGVRGLASILVLFQHIATDYGDWIHWGYHSRPQDNYFVQLPYIRLLFSGRFMVAIFFILSGYVLSYKPLKLFRKHDRGPLFDNLASGVFRRAPRLFLPAVPVMIVTAIFGVYYGCYGISGRPADGSCVPAAPSIWMQLFETWRVFLRMLHPFTWDEYYPPGVPQLWTLSMEFRGSMVVFLLVLCLGNTKPVIRMLLLLSTAYFSMHLTRWDTFLFISGVILAELRILRKDSIYTFDNLSKNPKLIYALKAASALFWSGILALALFIGSWPANGACTTPGFQLLCPYTPSQHGTGVPQQYFWISIAAILLLISLEHSPILQKPFVTPLATYFGNISFGLYIVHWPFLQTVGQWVIVKVIKATGTSVFEYGDFPPGFFLGGIVVMPVIVWLADVHWRLCDVKSVQFARWLSVKCSVQQD